ncbi:MFS general substrate transporter [Sodiomyces alkalinus F11]|uniref:MFS general substrate transporter n=1 Tax=Sodiomyces alkalinus (strain CBS 110278 / VKM F-3762 / F11) TaxID=1314773 RepID=A0A3N2QAJ7_SODAK|nr:MFS general substrate transporter [Sodiomyces alkalinus F11]ROT43783.1 MFS general substrate transporter [Sodiomyces alkalinus F11]
MAELSDKKVKAVEPTGDDDRQVTLAHTTAEVVLTKDGFAVHPQPVQGDPLDPLSWSSLQKHTILAIVMSLYFMFTYITTTTVPSFPDLEAHYSATAEEINWTVAIPALGLAFGPLLWSSLADILGRRPIFLLGTAIALASTAGAAVAPTYASYAAARFFQGLGVSPAATVGLAIINDVFFAHERGQKVGLWVLAIDTGLLAGPLVGGFVLHAGHAWLQWHCAVLFAAILVAEVLFLPETLYPRDLMLSRMRAGGGGGAAMRRKGGSATDEMLPEAVDDHEKGLVDVGADVRRTKTLRFVHGTPLPGMKHPKPWDTVVRFVKTFKYAVVPLTVGTYCFAWYWWVLSVITLVPVAYGDFSPQSQGLLFIGLIVGTLISEVLCSGTLSDRLVIRLAKRNGGVKTPEMRLWLAYPAAILTAVGLILWGVSVDKGHHWMVGQVAFALFGAGIQMGNTAVCSYIVDAYPLQSMAVIVFYAFSLNLSAFVDPFFILPWLDNVGFTWTMAGHAIITIVFCVPIFALVHVYGGRLREKNGEPDWVNPEFDHDIVTEDVVVGEKEG